MIRRGNWKLILGILCMNVVLMSAAYNMLIPFLPMYLITELGVSQAEVSLWTGMVFSITFLIGGLMAPIWGKLADKKGKKLMALRSSIMLAISYYGMGLVSTPEQLFAVRAFQGFAAGLISMFMAICSSTVPKEKTGISMGIFQAGLTIGTVTGPLLGGFLATYTTMRESFYIAGTFLLILSVATWFFIPEPQNRTVQTGKVEAPTAGILHRPEIREVLIYLFFLWMIILIIQPIMTLYVSQLCHGEGDIMLISGAIFSTIGIAGAITAPWWGKFGQKYGFYKVLAIGLIVSSFASAYNSIPDTVEGYAIANIVYALLFAGVLPSLNSITAMTTAPNERGRAYAYMFSAQQFGSVLGPLLGGLYVTFMPMNTVYYISGSVLLLLGIAVVVRHRQHW